MGSVSDVETNTTFRRGTSGRIIHKLLRTHTHAKRLRHLFFYNDTSYTLLSKNLDLAAQLVSLATLLFHYPLRREKDESPGSCRYQSGSGGAGTPCFNSATAGRI